MPEEMHGLELNFPINDEPSARLMLLKAINLLQAGEINVTEAATVFRRASEVVYRPQTRKAA